jgi:hypothetical protein
MQTVCSNDVMTLGRSNIACGKYFFQDSACLKTNIFWRLIFKLAFKEAVRDHKFTTQHLALARKPDVLLRTANSILAIGNSKSGFHPEPVTMDAFLLVLSTISNCCRFKPRIHCARQLESVHHCRLLKTCQGWFNKLDDYNRIRLAFSAETIGDANVDRCASCKCIT